jgi:hypothetical protein
MKSLCLILCLLAVSARAVIVPFALVSSKKKSSSCTVNSGNQINESWEGSDTLTWTDTGTVDRNAALSGTSPCSGLGSECAEMNWDGSATRPYTSHNRGSLLNSTLYFRFYFYIVSHSLASGEDMSIFAAGEDTNPSVSTMFFVKIHNAAGQLTIAAKTAASETTPINVSSATWYRAEFKYVVNSTGGSEFKLFDAGGSQVDTTKNWDTVNNIWQYTHVGIPVLQDAKAFRVQVDGLGVSDSGYLGQ